MSGYRTLIVGVLTSVIGLGLVVVGALDDDQDKIVQGTQMVSVGLSAIFIRLGIKNDTNEKPP